MFVKLLLIADVLLTATLALLHAFKPSFKYIPVIEKVEDEVKALENK